MIDKDGASSLPPRKRGRWLAFFGGTLLGVAGATLVPRYAGPYVEEALTPTAVVDGDVVAKEMQAERLLLKVTTPDGVLLASFTENRDDVDLLVESGSSVRLGADRYRPFLENPTILAVREPVAAAKPDTRKSSKEIYKEQLEARLRTWEAKLSELEERAGRASADVRSAYAEDLAELRAMRDGARGKLAELEHASGEAWKDLASGMDAAWSELEDALAEAASRFREQEPTG